MRTLLWREWLEQRRSHKLILAVVVLAVAGILGPLSAKFLPAMLAGMADVPPGLDALFPAPDLAMAVAEYSDNVVQFGALLAILLSMAAIVGEKSQGTAALTLSKPVSRFAFVVAKAAAISFTLLLGMTAASSMGYLYAGLLFEWPDPAQFAVANGLFWFYLVVIVSLTLLASALARSTPASAGLSFGALLALGVLGSVPTLGERLPAALLAWGRAVALGLPAEPAWASLALSAGLVFACVFGAWQVLLRQEI